MTAPESNRPIEILLVEDSPGAVALTREALREAKVHHQLHVVEDGVAALAFLRHDREYAGAPRPGLILLDLNLPRKDGRAVLAEIKADDRLKTIPVVVLTTSQTEVDILQAYGLHANCYITKPVDFAQFTQIVKTINDFWFTVVQLPRA